jgi:hypothetical protein
MGAEAEPGAARLGSERRAAGRAARSAEGALSSKRIEGRPQERACPISCDVL